MKFDRNTLLGFGLMAVLLIGYIAVTNKQQTEYNRKKNERLAAEKATQDSLAKLQKPKQDSAQQKQDSIATVNRVHLFKGAEDTTEKTTVVESDLLRVTFTNKGGQVKMVELKKFKGPDSNYVKLGASSFNKFSYPVNTGQSGPNGTIETGNEYFSTGELKKNADGSQSISFSLQGADSAATSGIVHTFTVKKDDYMIDFAVQLHGVNQLVTGGALNVNWQYEAVRQEQDLSYEKQQTQVSYVTDGSFDYHTISRKSHKAFDENVSWVGIRQRFFMAILSAKNKFSSGDWNWTDDSTNTVVLSTANMKVPVPAGNDFTVPFGLYYGPSDYHILTKYDQKFGTAVNLGQGIYSFVRPINKFLIIPIFDFLKGIAGSMGLAIALLTIFIKLITSPLLYKSYLSGAKMRLLRPELAKIKEKHGSDQQAYSMDQMKLFREAGVNPLGGCLPALLQIPVFFALFSLFNADVDMRGVPFLWSNDLAAYDQVIKFGVNIPLLGNHLSLFNLTAVITSFLISIYSMSMTPDQSNPVMKYMPYIFPVFLLFFFNSLPSALTWYYTVSNLITLGLQYVIQNYIIDHDKIMAKIEENRKKPKTKSKWQERLEQMQEQQKQMKERQQKKR